MSGSELCAGDDEASGGGGAGDGDTYYVDPNKPPTPDEYVEDAVRDLPDELAAGLAAFLRQRPLGQVAVGIWREDFIRFVTQQRDLIESIASPTPPQGVHVPALRDMQAPRRSAEVRELQTALNGLLTAVDQERRRIFAAYSSLMQNPIGSRLLQADLARRSFGEYGDVLFEANQLLRRLSGFDFGLPGAIGALVPRAPGISGGLRPYVVLGQSPCGIPRGTDFAAEPRNGSSILRIPIPPGEPETLGFLTVDGAHGPCTARAQYVAYFLLTRAGALDAAKAISGVDPQSGEASRGNLSPSVLSQLFSNRSVMQIVLQALSAYQRDLNLVGVSLVGV